MRTGTRLGVDVGSVRVGVARCDPDGLLATPLATLDRHPNRTGKPRRPDSRKPAPSGTAEGIDELAALARAYEAIEVVVGLPTGLSGQPGSAAAAATDYATRLAARVAPTPVRMVDERFSTVAATHNLRAAGRSVRSARPVIDQAAAVVILQGALDQERATGSPPGSVVDVVYGEARTRGKVRSPGPDGSKADK